MNGDWLFKAIPFFIVFCFVVIVVWWIATLAVKGAHYVEQNGLKSVVNQLWEGTSSQPTH
jgi:ABC-type phosphate transport system permease subunit